MKPGKTRMWPVYNLETTASSNCELSDPQTQGQQAPGQDLIPWLVQAHSGQC